MGTLPQIIFIMDNVFSTIPAFFEKIFQMWLLVITADDPPSPSNLENIKDSQGNSFITFPKDNRSISWNVLVTP